VSNRGSFGTACANVAVRGGGCWFYEIKIGTSKVIQIGWVLPGFDPNPESGLGVGDDAFSYAYDGRRKKKWFCGRSEEYCKQSCKAGDVVGCLLDLDEGYEPPTSISIYIYISIYSIMIYTVSLLSHDDTHTCREY
jgi:hypothetical protein